MKILILVTFIVFQLNCFAQSEKQKYNFDYKMIEVLGDLNKDGLLDKAIVSQDTLNENAPYRLQIFFKQTNGQLNLIATSTKIIESQYPNGRDGWRTGNGFSNITIKQGVLTVHFELMRGYYEHKFRFQKGNFELIGFSKVSSEGHGEMETIDFNLSTGIRIEKIERTDTNKVLSNKKKRILVRPLPKLQDVIPFENDLY